MKCQKCGTNEVNFHYSSNVNGCVAETHLCSKCAMESGYDLVNLFNELFPERGGVRGFMPMAIPVFKSNAFFPVTMRTQQNLQGQNEACNCGCETGKARQINVEVDEDMQIRRELNAQMRAAVEKEEFEKAAELRDKIKALETTATHRAVNVQHDHNTQEAGGNVKCDSETTSQDSPAVQ